MFQNIKVNTRLLWVIFWAGIVSSGILTCIYFTGLKQSPQINRCLIIKESSQKIICWKKIIDKDLSKGDLNRAMDTVSVGYAKDFDFAKNCHDFMHSVGKTAYDLFSGGKSFTVGEKTRYCAYGFYHGFMESLVSRSGDISMARSFCAKVDKELANSAPGAKLACYHGIGHGWTNVHDPQMVGNERAMVAPALGLCEKITQDSEELKICATGVFDSISIGYYNEEGGLKIKKEDPYWLCKEQNDKYKTPCYMDLTPAIVWLGDYKLDKSLQYIQHVEPKYRDLVVETIAEDVVRFIIRENLNVGDQVGVCRSLGLKQNLICIGGIAKGYLQFGAPGREEEAGLNFCETGGLNEQEKDYCYSKLIGIIKFSVPKDRYEKVCSSITQIYKKYCEI